MGWFRRTVQPQQDQVVPFENPLFAEPTADAAEQVPAGLQLYQDQLSEHPESPDADVDLVETSCTALSPACQHSPAAATSAPGPRSAAGLSDDIPASSSADTHPHLLQQHQGLHARHSLSTSQGDTSSSRSVSGAGGIKGRCIPAPLLLPEEDLAEAQGTAVGGTCCSPGTVASDGPAEDALHVPTRSCKPAQPAHRPLPSTPIKHAGTPSSAAAAAATPTTAGRSNLGGVSTAAACSPAAASAKAYAQLQHAPSTAGTAPGAAAAEFGMDDLDDLLADMTSCLGNLQHAAQLARSRSGIRPDRPNPGAAAARAPLSEVSAINSSRHSTRVTPASASTHPAAAALSTEEAFALVSGKHSSRQGVSTGAAPAAQPGASAATGGGGGSSSLPGARQLAKGRSRLHATSSNAWDVTQLEQESEDDGDDYDSIGSGSGSGVPSSHHSPTGSSCPGSSLVLMKSGASSRAVVLTDGRSSPAASNRGSSSGTSSTGNGSSREGSVHGSNSRTLQGSHSSHSSSSREGSVHNGTAVPQPTTAAPAAAAPVANEVKATYAGRGQQMEAKLQEQQERQQRALLLQQEQQVLQERRQQKQERVQASYACVIPHTSRPSSGINGSSSNRNSTGDSSRPTSSKTAPAAVQNAGAIDSWAVPVQGGTPAAARAAAAASGHASAAAAAASQSVLPAAGWASAAALAAPGSLADAWSAIQAASPKGPPGVRPASAAPLAATRSAVLVGSGGSLVLGKASGGLRVAASIASASGGLLSPQPPSTGALPAGGVPSPRAKSAAASIAAAAGSATLTALGNM